MELWQLDIVDSLKLDARPRWSWAVDERLPPRPTTRSDGRRVRFPSGTPRRAGLRAVTPDLTMPVALVLSTKGGEPVDRAAESTRVVPLSGHLAVCGQSVADEEDQFDRARSCSSPSVVSPSGPLP
jgi:hypothetical protein